MADSRLHYNIYCDESCHLEHDDSRVMVLGAVWCLRSKRFEIFKRIREIKAEHNLNAKFEIKWNKVSESKIGFYLDVINYFFDNDDLHFRALVVPDKSLLDHESHNQDHNTFYYKMYFNLIKVILYPRYTYNIYIDVKDTKSADKVVVLNDALNRSQYDFQKKIVRGIQQVHSKDVEVLQLADLLSGAISYLHRGLNTNPGKVKLIEKIKVRSGYNLTQSTLYKEEKVNIFIWQPQETIV